MAAPKDQHRIAIPTSLQLWTEGVVNRLINAIPGIALHVQKRSPYPEVSRIEKSTGRTVTIETELTQEALAKCWSQEQSPLFRLPAELRNLIYFALATEDYREQIPHMSRDPSNPTIVHRFARPQHCTALPQTCRRIWLEASHLPMLGTHRFQLNRSLSHLILKNCGGTKDASRKIQYEGGRLQRFLTSLTPNGKKRLHHLYLYVNGDALVYRPAWTLPLSLLTTQYGYISGACPEILTLAFWTLSYLIRKPLLSWDIQDEAIQNLLDHPAMGRLREIRLDVHEVYKDTSEHWLQRIGRAQRMKGRVSHVDARGMPTRWICQSAVPLDLSMPWERDTWVSEGWFDKPSDIRGRGMRLTWTLVVADAQENESSLQEHRERAHQKPAELTTTAMLKRAAAAAKWEKKWLEDSSLLKFDQ